MTSFPRYFLEQLIRWLIWNKRHFAIGNESYISELAREIGNPIDVSLLDRRLKVPLCWSIRTVTSTREKYRYNSIYASDVNLFWYNGKRSILHRWFSRTLPAISVRTFSDISLFLFSSYFFINITIKSCNKY